MFVGLFTVAASLSSCRFLRTESLEVENRSDFTVTVTIDTIGRAEIAPHTSATVEVGRGLTPSGVTVSGDGVPNPRPATG